MRVWDYPKDTVAIKCDQCHREGHYPKERFIELVGRDASLVEALRIIIKDCPVWIRTEYPYQVVVRRIIPT